MEYGTPSGRELSILRGAVAAALGVAVLLASLIVAVPGAAAAEQQAAEQKTTEQKTTEQKATAETGVSLASALRGVQLGSIPDTVRAVVAEARNGTPLASGSAGIGVAVLQQRLTDLGYRPGPVDGRFGAQTASAVLAFQKFESLDRTHTANAQVLERMWAPQGQGPRSDILGVRVEIDLVRQVLLVVGPDGTHRIINTSTGGNYEYEDPRTGNINVAYTPTGNFAVGYRYNGMEVAPLGELYRPLYFYGGWAIHGSTSVPEYPASHGCARTSFADQDWIWDEVPSGTPVYVY